MNARTHPRLSALVKEPPAAGDGRGGKVKSAPVEPSIKPLEAVSTDITKRVPRGTPDAGSAEADLAGALEGRGAILLERLRGVAKQHKAPDEDYAAMIRWTAEKAKSGEIPEIGDFGPVFHDLKGDWRGAVTRLQEVRGGDAVGVLRSPAAGPVDVVWGWKGTPEKTFEDGYGLAKITEKHPGVIERIPDIVREGKANRDGNAMTIRWSDVDSNNVAVVKLDWFGKEKRWLLTAFEEKPAPAGKSIGSPGDLGGAPPAPRSGSFNTTIPPSPFMGQGAAHGASDEAFLARMWHERPDLVMEAGLTHEKALRQQASLDMLTWSVADELGLAERPLGKVKKVKSLVEKVIRKEGEGYAIADIKDHARGTIILDDFSQVPAVVEALSRRAKITGEASVEEPLNRFGYRGVHLATKLDEGINGEIQLHTKRSWMIKKQTDPIYRKWRNLTDEEYNAMTLPQKATYKADFDHSYALWARFWDGVAPEVKASARSSVMGLESVMAPSLPLKGTHAPLSNTNKGLAVPSVAPSSTRPSPSNANLGHLNLSSMESTSASSISPSPLAGQPAVRQWGPVRSAFEAFIGPWGRSADGTLKQISKRGITAVDELRDMFFAEPGGARGVGEHYFEGVQKGISDYPRPVRRPGATRSGRKNPIHFPQFQSSPRPKTGRNEIEVEE